MLTHNNKEVFAGMSRKQIEERGGYDLLVQSKETLVPKSHKGVAGFSLMDRATHPFNK